MSLRDTEVPPRGGSLLGSSPDSGNADGFLLPESVLRHSGRKEALAREFLDKPEASSVDTPLAEASARVGGQVASVCGLRGVAAIARSVTVGAAREVWRPSAGPSSSPHFLPPFRRSSLRSRSLKEDLKGAATLGAASSPPLSLGTGAMFSFWSSPRPRPRRSQRRPPSGITPSLVAISVASRLRRRSGEARGEARGDEHRDEDRDESLRMDARLTGPRLLPCCRASGPLTGPFKGLSASGAG